MKKENYDFRDCYKMKWFKEILQEAHSIHIDIHTTGASAADSRHYTFNEGILSKAYRIIKTLPVNHPLVKYSTQYIADVAFSDPFNIVEPDCEINLGKAIENYFNNKIKVEFYKDYQRSQMKEIFETEISMEHIDPDLIDIEVVVSIEPYSGSNLPDDPSEIEIVSIVRKDGGEIEFDEKIEQQICKKYFADNPQSYPSEHELVRWAHDY